MTSRQASGWKAGRAYRCSARGSSGVAAFARPRIDAVAPVAEPSAPELGAGPTSAETNVAPVAVVQIGSSIIIVAVPGPG